MMRFRNDEFIRTLDPEDLELFVKTNSVDKAFDFITTEHALAEPGGAL